MTLALGRHVEHDEASRTYPAATAPQVRAVLWPHTAPVLDQGQLGSCTGNALAQCLNTTHFDAARHGEFLTEDHAVDLYERATELDTIPGQYPPTDTGSSGLAVCKAGKALGYLSGYRHAFGMDHFLSAIQVSPVIVGTEWFEAMFRPDRRGRVTLGGAVAGGHEYLVLGADPATQLVTCLNSWGPTWGQEGRFTVSFRDFATLLARSGDVTVPIGVTA